MCDVAGLPVLKHSLGELGVAMYAGAQLMATCSNALHANQSYASFLADDIIEGVDALTYHSGRLAVPTGPGIGVALDRQKLERFKENYILNHEKQSQQPRQNSFVPLWPKL
jgi:L-alanine-DL-glutamate epimerase-like enolase superfamily enzyme